MKTLALYASKLISLVGIVVVLTLTGCAQNFTPITKQNLAKTNSKSHISELSLCDIFKREPEWYTAAANMENKWGTPIPMAMAIVKQESSFIHNARPIRKNAAGRKIGFASSAYGYSQALDGTWADFKKVAGGRVDRTDFADSLQFIGWYTSLSKQELSLSWRKASEHYLAYHEGRTGYSRGRHEGKTALLNIADKVEKQAKVYQKQLKNCRSELEEQSRFSLYAKN